MTNSHSHEQHQHKTKDEFYCIMSLGVWFSFDCVIGENVMNFHDCNFIVFFFLIRKLLSILIRWSVIIGFVNVKEES